MTKTHESDLDGAWERDGRSKGSGSKSSEGSSAEDECAKVSYSLSLSFSLSLSLYSLSLSLSLSLSPNTIFIPVGRPGRLQSLPAQDRQEERRLQRELVR